MSEMRLQRFLAQAGLASRRKAEEMITAGRVKVNGRVVSELGSKVDSIRDEVTVGGRKLLVQPPVYLLLNKPKGYVTTLSDPEGRPTVMELVGKVEERVYPIGRLDFNTEGVLLLTNDGDLAHALMHPTREVKKTYRVKLRGLAGAEMIDSLREGVTLDDGERTAPAQVEIIGNTEGGNNSWLEITIHEGASNRQIHRHGRVAGHGGGQATTRAPTPASTPRAAARCRWRSLRRDEVDGLRRAAGMARPTTFEDVKKRAAPRRPARGPSAEKRGRHDLVAQGRAENTFEASTEGPSLSLKRARAAKRAPRR